MNTAPTEFPFTLPHGLVDAEGMVHREGAMRLATAYDEIAPMKDPRVQSNPAYLAIILLARVVTRLGDLAQVNPKVIENLCARDARYLQDQYFRINGSGHDRLAVTCPECEARFEAEINPVGEASATP